MVAQAPEALWLVRFTGMSLSRELTEARRESVAIDAKIAGCCASSRCPESRASSLAF